MVAGFLAGLLGVGGGMMMVPVLSWLLVQRGVPSGPAVKIAIATSMATILFTSLSSVRAHHKLGAVRWNILRGLASGIVLCAAAVAGAFACSGPGPCTGLRPHRLFCVRYSDRQPSPHRAMPGLA